MVFWECETGGHCLLLQFQKIADTSFKLLALKLLFNLVSNSHHTRWGLTTLSLKKLYGPFLWMGFNCLKAAEPLRWGSLLFTTKFPEIPGNHLIDLGRIKDWVYLGAFDIRTLRDSKWRRKIVFPKRCFFIKVFVKKTLRENFFFLQHLPLHVKMRLNIT